MPCGLNEIRVEAIPAIRAEVGGVALLGAGGGCNRFVDFMTEGLYELKIVHVTAILAGSCGITLGGAGGLGYFFGGFIVMTLVAAARGEGEKGNGDSRNRRT